MPIAAFTGYATITRAVAWRGLGERSLVVSWLYREAWELVDEDDLGLCGERGGSLGLPFSV